MRRDRGRLITQKRKDSISKASIFLRGYLPAAISHPAIRQHAILHTIRKKGALKKVPSIRPWAPGHAKLCKPPAPPSQKSPLPTMEESRGAGHPAPAPVTEAGVLFFTCRMALRVAGKPRAGRSSLASVLSRASPHQGKGSLRPFGPPISF